jgi:hypothetical protein
MKGRPASAQEEVEEEYVSHDTTFGFARRLFGEPMRGP